MTPKRRRRFFWVGAALLILALPMLVGLAQFVTERLADPVDENTRLHLQRAGTGPRIFALHGLAGSGRYYTERATEIGAFELVAPDLLGFGESPRPSGPSVGGAGKHGPYTLEQHAALVEGELRALGVSAAAPILVVGHSFGSIVALELARRAPELVEGVVVVSLPIFDGREDAAERLSNDSMMAAAVAREDGWAQLSCMFHRLYRIPQLAPFLGVPEDVFMDATRHSWTSLAGTLEDAILATDVRALARQVKRPLLFGHGALDKTASFARVEALAKELGAPLVRHERGGHQVILEDPAWLGGLIRRALSGRF